MDTSIQTSFCLPLIRQLETPENLLKLPSLHSPIFMWASLTLYLHIFTVHIISSPKPSHSILQGITN